MPSADVADALRDGAGDLLESLELFDVFTGDQVGAGNKSSRSRCASAPVTAPSPRTRPTPPNSPPSTRPAAVSEPFAMNVGRPVRGCTPVV